MIWALLAHAQAEGGRWTVGLAGVLLLGLPAAVASLCAVCPGRLDDVEGEALAGLVEAMAHSPSGGAWPPGSCGWLATGQAPGMPGAHRAGAGVTGAGRSCHWAPSSPQICLSGTAGRPSGAASGLPQP